MNLKKNLHKICNPKGLKNFHYVYFIGEFLVVANEKMLVKQHYSLHGITAEEMGLLDGRAIHFTEFAYLLEVLKSKYPVNLVVESGAIKWGDNEVELKTLKELEISIDWLLNLLPKEGTEITLEEGNTPMIPIDSKSFALAGEVSFAHPDNYGNCALALDCYKNFYCGEGRNVTDFGRTEENLHIEYLERILLLRPCFEGHYEYKPL